MMSVAVPFADSVPPTGAARAQRTSHHGVQSEMEAASEPTRLSPRHSPICPPLQRSRSRLPYIPTRAQSFISFPFVFTCDKSIFIFSISISF